MLPPSENMCSNFIRNLFQEVVRKHRANKVGLELTRQYLFSVEEAGTLKLGVS